MKKDALSKKNKLRVLVVSLISFIAGALYSATTEEIALFHLLSGGVVGLIIGFFIVYTETYIAIKISKRFNFLITLLIRSSLYTGVIMGVLILNSHILYLNKLSAFNVSQFINDESFSISILFSISIAVFFIAMFQINDLIGRGVLVKFILGRYHSPREEKKIFMFLDLKDSTAIAERIGHINFMSLINDFFFDLTNPVLSTGGEIYKYVGDEAIITWNFNKGINKLNAINTFFFLKEVMEERKAYYLDKYNLIPEFKAGLHGGKVVTGEVGVSKKEITYLGDIINTTSRIEGMCNTLNEDLLISEELYKIFIKSNKLNSRVYKDIKLRGKKDIITLYGIG